MNPTASGPHFVAGIRSSAWCTDFYRPNGEDIDHRKQPWYYNVLFSTMVLRTALLAASRRLASSNAVKVCSKIDWNVIVAKNRKCRGLEVWKRSSGCSLRFKGLLRQGSIGSAVHFIFPMTNYCKVIKGIWIFISLLNNLHANNMVLKRKESPIMHLASCTSEIPDSFHFRSLCTWNWLISADDEVA